MRRNMGTRTLVALGLLIWFAGCGRAVGGAVSAGPPPYTNTSPPTLSDGAVRLAVDHATYRPNEPIHATVINSLSQSLYALDTRSSCSILSLEWQVGGAWQPAQGAECPLGRVALVVAIGAGATYHTTITAGFPGLRAATFPTGVYRLVLVYSLAQLGPGATGTGTAVYSASFTIAGAPLPPIPTEPTVPIAVTVTLVAQP